MKAKYAREIRTGIVIGQEFLSILSLSSAGSYLAAMQLARIRLEGQPENTQRAFQRTLAKYSY